MVFTHLYVTRCHGEATLLMYLLICLQCRTPVDGQMHCPKHIEFHSKNKFEKLVHLVDFVIRIYHDARSHECQTYPIVRKVHILKFNNMTV
jgi:hypothetical protein